MKFIEEPPQTFVSKNTIEKLIIRQSVSSFVIMPKPTNQMQTIKFFYKKIEKIAKTVGIELTRFLIFGKGNADELIGDNLALGNEYFQCNNILVTLFPKRNHQK